MLLDAAVLTGEQPRAPGLRCGGGSTVKGAHVPPDSKAKGCQ